MPATSDTTGSTTGYPSNVILGPNKVIYNERHISDHTWPSTLILDLRDGNWLEWSRRLELFATRIHVFDYLNGSLLCPDASQFPAAHSIWRTNDRSLRAFILEKVTPDKYDAVTHCTTSHATFEALRIRNEQLGIHAQVNLIHNTLDVYYDHATSLAVTTKIIRDAYERLRRMGKIDEDMLLCVFLVNSLGRDFPHLQSAIYNMADEPNFSAAKALK